MPFADPPPGVTIPGQVPYAVTVALWYAFSILCLVVGVHLLARALERGSPDPAVRSQPAGCRRWWRLRTLPVLVCVVPLGHTLMRGQVNLLLLALVCGVIAGVVSGRRLAAGVCLAGGMALKIFPAFMVLYPLWRRDRRCLAGWVLGSVLFLVVVPAVVIGPRATVESYPELYHVLVSPALGTGADQSRAKELIEVTATDTQSILAVIHNNLHPDRNRRPSVASPEVRRLHWVVGGGLTLLTLLAAGRRRDSAIGETLFVGALVVNMILLSPVCHLHYFVLSLFLAMGLAAAAWERQGTCRMTPGLWLMLVLNVAANIPPHVPGMEPLRDCGLATAAALSLWAAGLITLARMRRPAGEPGGIGEVAPAAAA
jgi:hypothetical protein